MTIQPQMPTTWDSASIEKVAMGNNLIDVKYERKGTDLTLVINQTAPDWHVKLAFPKNKYHTWQVNGKKVPPQHDGEVDFVDLPA